MTITVHRGTHQIGGCCTEIETANTRIFIDFGTELPDRNGRQKPETLCIPGLTESPPRCDGVFFTHAHGDHIGNIHRIKQKIPLYMGESAREISTILNNKLQDAYTRFPDSFEDHSPTLAALNRATPFRSGEPITELEGKGVRVTPLRIDHSAFDSYMFFIETEAGNILHTGDFRDHGFTGDTLLPTLAPYAGRVDWLIAEGTMLSREGEHVMTEADLAKRAQGIIKEHKNVFVLCSSTNIDRIRAFYEAKPRRRPAVCDQYQKNVLDAVSQSRAGQAFSYDFQWVIPDHGWNYKLHNWMDEQGFVMFVRATEKFRKIMEPYRNNCKVIYSMWNGYLEQDNIKRFLDGFDWVPLHTSGHATQETLREVFQLIQPRKGVIPIHTEYPERFRQLFAGAHIILLADGSPFVLP